VVSHGLSSCNKKIIKNKLVGNRSGDFTIFENVVVSGKVVGIELAPKEGI
jgi:hypothetical protein